jgi:hypothetical protein
MGSASGIQCDHSAKLGPAWMAFFAAHALSASFSPSTLPGFSKLQNETGFFKLHECTSDLSLGYAECFDFDPCQFVSRRCRHRRFKSEFFIAKEQIFVGYELCENGEIGGKAASGHSGTPAAFSASARRCRTSKLLSGESRTCSDMRYVG